ncbi:MAG: energy-coupling factor transporter ATPase [Mycoplasmoidaceae bacterium]
MNKKIIIKLDNIHFSYNDNNEIIKGVNFNIYENEYVCILGHNGSGKSTISKILMGLLEPSIGTIDIFGIRVDSKNIKYLRDNISIIFQNPDSQFIGLTVEDDIAFGLENRNYDRLRIKEVINNISKKLNIEKFLDCNCQQLSGGQKQLVAIASALAINSNVIIFDESTSMLDPKGKSEIKKIMFDLRKKENKTIISITHDMEEILLADRIIIFENGKLVEEGNSKDIFTNREKLEKLSLSFPFILGLSNFINEKNKNINLSLHEKDLLEQLCRIK